MTTPLAAGRAARTDPADPGPPFGLGVASVLTAGLTAAWVGLAPRLVGVTTTERAALRGTAIVLLAAGVVVCGCLSAVPARRKPPQGDAPRSVETSVLVVWTATTAFMVHAGVQILGELDHDPLFLAAVALTGVAIACLVQLLAALPSDLDLPGSPLLAAFVVVTAGGRLLLALLDRLGRHVDLGPVISAGTWWTTGTTPQDVLGWLPTAIVVGVAAWQRRRYAAARVLVVLVFWTFDAVDRAVEALSSALTTPVVVRTLEPVPAWLVLAVLTACFALISLRSEPAVVGRG